MMRLFRVMEDDRMVWVAALAHENMYGYVANTGRFHDNNALRNDFYMDRDFTYAESGIAEARRLIETGVEPLDEEEYAEILAEWRADQRSLDPTETLSMAAGHNP
ncbi:hypothetical protein EV643_12267 [Kribbella sp. VKM Ac-2527]|uniref:Uncharacterized protein n=1 Tax=Kribbella caucasensis TaxID=2512215 RepID=A0A4R6JLS6_9ACTN|nr:hypothetical protein [Kribbella sp. VKM Ac-2527]TDO35656.1 hypothetical protein EV643_12267 [Kribbella sp. VKM Ac-2527]